MKLIDRNWWDHLAPQPLQRFVRDLEERIRDLAHSPYGKIWLQAAMSPGASMRIDVGQPIPVLQLTSMGGTRPFVAPFQNLKSGHRQVTSSGDQSDAIRGLQLVPEIRVELVTDPQFVRAAQIGLKSIDEDLIKEPSQIFSCPAHMLISPRGYPKKSYVLYQHIFGNGATYPDDGFFYVGITTRSWQKRWAEHRRSIETDSPLLFHRKFREELSSGRLTYVHHKVMAATNDIDHLYEIEEKIVAGHWHDNRRLNMVPGGKSGLRYMRENGMLANSVAPIPDERDSILQRWMIDHPRKGVPAPWVAERWADNEWAVSQICGRDGRLSVEQVRAIRSLIGHASAEEITTRIGALNISQVQRVINGKTYNRVN